MSENNKNKSEQMAPEAALIFSIIYLVTSVIPLGIMNTSYVGGTLLVLLILSACDALKNFINPNELLAYISQEDIVEKKANVWRIWIKTLSLISFTACVAGLVIMAFTMGNIAKGHYAVIILACINSSRLTANTVFLSVLMWKKH